MSDIIIEDGVDLYGLLVVYDPEEWGNKKPDVTICKGREWAEDLLRESEKWIGVAEAHVVKARVEWQPVTD